MGVLVLTIFAVSILELRTNRFESKSIRCCVLAPLQVRRMNEKVVDGRFLFNDKDKIVVATTGAVKLRKIKNTKS